MPYWRRGPFLAGQHRCRGAGVPTVGHAEMLVEAHDPVAGRLRLVGNPVKIEGQAGPAERRIPRLEHTDDVLAGLLASTPTVSRRCRRRCRRTPFGAGAAPHSLSS